MRPVGVAVVGAGAWATYALERLSAEVPARRLAGGLSIHIFERTGRFGAGSTHDDRQPVTSYLNRVASQLSFAADESNRDAVRLLPRELRPTFVEWCQDRYKATGDTRFDLASQDVPRRYLHGLALAERFEVYVDLLRAIHGVTVDVHALEVTDLVPQDKRLLVVAGEHRFAVDHVLMATGQPENRPAPGSSGDGLARHASAQPTARYVACPYPLEDRLTTATVPPGCRVAVRGLGLTAVDLILHLTEGRSGTFDSLGLDRPDSQPVYRRSGREPHSIVAVSPSGMLPWCRPMNEKAADQSGIGHAALEYEPRFLNLAAVDHLRENLGRPAQLSSGWVRQLDFERHVFPLVVLEMAHAYYSSLLGAAAVTGLCEAASAAYHEHFRSGHRDHEAAIDALLEPVDRWFDDIAAHVVTGRAEAAAAAFRQVIGWHRGAWGGSSDIFDYRFRWRDLFDPLGAEKGVGADWQDRMIDHLRRDQAAAIQGNLSNPLKAACDGVWRDLRWVFSAALDRGGLTADSYRRFQKVYLRHYTRMSNGTGIEPMRKILALIHSGVLDVSIGPEPTIDPMPDQPTYLVSGRRSGVTREVDVVIEGRGHTFDPGLDRAPLYRNLIARGLVRQWRIPAPEGPDLVPGPLDLSRAFHPYRADGTVDLRLTVLGAPAEGLVFFQLSAARPHTNNAVLNTVARWANELLDLLESASSAGRRTPID